VHQDAQRLPAIVLEDQGLDHGMLVDAEVLGGGVRAPWAAQG